MKTGQFYQEAKLSRPELSVYNFRPAGHTAPPPQREYKEPDRALEKAFERWLNKDGSADKFNTGKLYEEAVTDLEGIDVSVSQAHGLFLAHRDIITRTAPSWLGGTYLGLFLSAVYNKSDQRFIVWDIDFDVPVAYLGIHLPEDKTFINYSDNCEMIGCSSRGTIINYGYAGSSMGQSAKGVLINCGETGSMMGQCASGPVINYGKVIARLGNLADGDVFNFGEELMPMSKIPIRGSAPEIRVGAGTFRHEEWHAFPELLDYFDNLKSVLDAGRTDHKALSAIPPADKIKSDIEDILRRAGKL